MTANGNDGNAAGGRTLLARIAAATELREGPEGVAGILRAAFRSGPLPLNVLARAVRLPLPVAGAVRRELETAGLFERGGGVRLSEAGHRFCELELGLVASLDRLPASPSPGGGDVPERLRSVLALMEAHLATGPAVDVTLDQAPCTAETAVRRAIAMREAGAVEGRSIAIVGDDDSMSLAIPLVARELGGPPRRIAVFEIDPTRCEQLETAARRHGFSIEVIRHDLRDPLPASHVGLFDAFETDPPYTLDGMALFALRAMEAMRSEPGLPGFLSYADLAPGDQLALVRRLAELGLAPMRITPSFNRYAGASILGSVGQFIELRTTGAAPAGTGRYELPIYTGEVRPRWRRYRCRACGTATIVGHGEAFATIETLKAAGCPNCSEKVFRREGLVAR